MKRKYKIRTLSVRNILGYAEAVGDHFAFRLGASATRRCFLYRAEEQDDCALFHQIMCALHSGNFPTLSDEQTVIPDLEDAIFYADFSGIFDHGSSQRYLERQRKAESMFRPEGVRMDFGTGEHSYLAFERSGSMSRQARLSFIRADLYGTVRERIMLGMTVGDCQLSKLYAYLGLMLSGGTRIDSVGLTDPHRIVVIEDAVLPANLVKCITVEGGELRNGMRKYRRVGGTTNLKSLLFDGEGLISKRYAKTIDRAYCDEHIHTSFQIRLPFVKGMLHQVDFKDFLSRVGCEYIADVWGVKHPVGKVDVILTKSMFKGYGWLTENGMGWEDYLAAVERYDHALYITNTSKPEPQEYTELNYQFLTTLSMTADEFRPRDLPPGWEHSPSEDRRNWITKATEQRYYDFRANEEFRLSYFAKRRDALARVLKKNPLFVNEPVCTDELDAQAKHTLEQYTRGRLLVAGDNRFLSGDLMLLLKRLAGYGEEHEKETIGTLLKELRRSYASERMMASSSFYAPAAAYRSDGACTLLRNPHIARNEEIQLEPYQKGEPLRDKYLGHLTDVVMTDVTSLAAERLGGADYDGDMVKTIADPLLNECVRRNYVRGNLDRDKNLPLLHIPSEEPVIRNANDWHDRFVTVRDTFSSRVGQICNAAFDRSVIAYDENSDAEERERCREETELLAILTGLEIDSAKSGVKPDIDEYIKHRTVQRSAFLQYKVLLDDDGDRVWYEPTTRQKKKDFIETTDWDAVSSNVERLPYLAYLLEKYTPKLKPKIAADEELFIFAKRPDWKERLDKPTLDAVATLLGDYEKCLTRIRGCRAPIRGRRRQSDIERILYGRGQEELYDTDTLYAAFSGLEPERVGELRQAIREQAWHLMDRRTRLAFLRECLPDYEDFFSLLSDFRFGGYRVLGDLICDVDDENRAEERRQLFRERDSDAFRDMMQAYLDKPLSQSYKDAVAKACRKRLDKIVKPRFAVSYVVALGKRKLLWELLPDAVEENAVRYRGAKDD